MGEAVIAKQEPPFSCRRATVSRTIIAVIGLTTPFATGNPGLERLFTQIAALGKCQEGFDNRTRQSNRMFAIVAPFFGRGFHGTQSRSRADQSRSSSSTIRAQSASSARHVLREARTQLRQPCIDFAQAVLAPHPCNAAATAAHKGLPLAFQNPGLFGRQIQVHRAAAIAHVDAGKQLGVWCVVSVLCLDSFGRDFALSSPRSVSLLCAHTDRFQKIAPTRDSCFSGQFKRHHRIFVGRCVSLIIGNGIDVCTVAL